jgi:hypothetical protein
VTTKPKIESHEGTEPPESLVTSRASGRPPEELDSDCPKAQAREILEDSEERTLESAEDSAHK